MIPTGQRLPRRVADLVVIAALAALPLVAGDYLLSLMVVGGIYAILSIGLNLFMGQTGQISFGHNAFAALGGYGTAVLSATYGWPPLAALLAAALLSTLVAIVVGLPTLRLRGHYLAMATLALGLIAYELAGQLKSVTAGFLGISGIPALGLGPWHLASDRAYYYAIWLLVALGLLIAQRITHSRLGRALGAVAGNEEAARALGIDVSRYKLVAFAVSAVYASVAGSLLAHYVSFISPEVFGLSMVTLLFTMLFLGGIGTPLGPVLGAVLISVLPAMLSRFEDYRQLVYGVLLLAVILFAPRGLYSLAELRRSLAGGSR
jgi:branched-chain amino acid transport system permease protein